MTTPGTDTRALAALKPSSQQTRQVFPGSARQLADVRHFVRETLTGCDTTDDAVLLTTELATNAIQHTASGTGGSFAVTIHQRPRSARITVTDNGSAGIPIPAPPNPGDVSGRGLALVQALADDWGHHGDRHSRSVWFDIGLPADRGQVTT
jgi:anti-sigma regulatory factor (Ser/Thr protein kinase)